LLLVEGCAAAAVAVAADGHPLAEVELMNGAAEVEAAIWKDGRARALMAQKKLFFFVFICAR
jgi:hypothetical protein